MTRSASGGHRCALRDDGEAAAGRRVPVREPLGPAIVLGERSDDPQLSGRMRKTRLQHESAHDRCRERQASPTTAIPPDAGMTTGASVTIRARRRSAEAPVVRAAARRAAARSAPRPCRPQVRRRGRQQSARSPRGSSGIRRHRDAAPAVAVVPRSCRTSMSSASRASAASVAAAVRRRSLRAARLPSRNDATAMSGPRSANHSDSSDPVTSHSTTAPTRGTTDRERSGRRPGGGGRFERQRERLVDERRARSGREASRRRTRRPVKRAAGAEATAWQPTSVEKRGQLRAVEDAAACAATSSTMIVMLSRPPFSSAASSMAVTASAGSACSSRKCWMP